MRQTTSSVEVLLQVRRVAVAATMAALIASVGVSSASADTVIGATFEPDHGSVGTWVVVTGLPLAVDCPNVDLWLARGVTPSPPIVSRDDPRLIKLGGAVSYQPIGAGGFDDQRRATTFVFRVSAIAPGTYGTYMECSGGNADFAGFFPGHTTFTVVVPATPVPSSSPSLPPTPTPSPSPVSTSAPPPAASSAPPSTPASPSDAAGLIGALAIGGIALAFLLGRSTVRTTPHPD